MTQNYYGEPTYYVYIMTNKPKGTYYTGITSDIVTRAYQHRNHLFKNSFTDKYKLTKLVWFETHREVRNAISREKLIKRYKRDWKENLIVQMNPDWDDLWFSITNVKQYIPPPIEYFEKILKEFQDN